MNTILLYWNQTNTDFDSETFLMNISEIDEVNCHKNEQYSELWFDNYKLFLDPTQKVGAGDHFFIYCYGGKNNGICISGYLSSDYYEEEQIIDGGRIVGHLDLVPNYMIHPDHHQILSGETLKTIIPEYEWDYFAYGRILNSEVSVKVEKIWKSFLEENPALFSHWSAIQSFDFSQFVPQKEETVYIGLTDDGKFKAHNYRCDLDIECDDVETVQKRSIEILEKKYGKSKEIKFEFHDYFCDNNKFVESVLKLISNSCKGVKDESGNPIIWQIIKASRIDSLHGTRIIAMFLKLIELNLIKETDLEQEGIPHDLIETIHVLIKNDNESYETYIDKVAQNLQGRDYMIDALRDKLNIVYRYKELKDEDFDNLRKWLKAYHKLMDIRLSEIRNESKMHNFWQNK